MHDLTILLVGVMVGLGLGVIVSAVRRTPVVGGPAAPEATDLTVVPTGIPGQTKLRYSKTFVKRRIEMRVEPDGIAVTVDGTTYHGIDEIPDPATREQVRHTLEGLPAQVTDPVLRAKVEGELEALGITPDPHA
jgi:hypothetical protein